MYFYAKFQLNILKHTLVIKEKNDRQNSIFYPALYRGCHSGMVWISKSYLKAINSKGYVKTFPPFSKLSVLVAFRESLHWLKISAWLASDNVNVFCRQKRRRQAHNSLKSYALDKKVYSLVFLSFEEIPCFSFSVSCHFEIGIEHADCRWYQY